MSRDGLNESIKGEGVLAAIAIARLVVAIAAKPQAQRFVMFRTGGTKRRRGQVRVRAHDEMPQTEHEVLGVYTPRVTLAQLVADLSVLDEGSR